MADDDIDVEGEFDLKTELGDEFYDTNELPSKSANLLPEFTSPAWMLEQGWSLDSCMDEKSKATIEKMLLEEQQYMYGRKTSRYLSIKKNVLLVTAGTSKTTTPNKSPWTQEEKNTFLRGMGIFGRSWSKIASLIPTRTSLQVKNYAQQYMKNLAKKKAEMERNERETLKSMSEAPLFTPNPSSLADTVVSVTTGQPTIPVATTSSSKLNVSASQLPIGLSDLSSKTSTSATKTKRPNPQQAKVSAVSTKPSTNAKPQKKVSKGKKNSKKTKKINSTLTNGVIAYADVSESTDANQEADLISFVNNKFRNRGSRSDSVGSTTDGALMANCSSDLSNSSSAKDLKGSDDEDEDIEVDIDIENDDNENSVLQSRSTSPSSVYQQLLKSAHIESEKLVKVKLQSVEVESAVELDYNNENSPQTDTNGNARAFERGEDFPKLEESDSCDTVFKSETLSDDNSKDKQEDEEEEHHVETESIVNGLVAATGEVIEFDIPQEEKVFLPNTITEEEKRVHADFFDGRPPKTPERYLKIRNYIIDCWLKSKPTYLNKTCIRPGLKNCGDVNCIGRIHSYLECVGAINFGCDQAAYRNPHRTVGGGTNSRVKGINKDLMASFPVSKSESTRPRKRRIRDGTGLWVDEKELEGKTIEHDTERKKSDAARKPKVPRSSKIIYDPFKLVPCLPFSEDNKAPYSIEVFNTALAIMDIHAHISKTEVIGMLGGHFCADTGHLTISMAVPCKSMSTGMQCEMDPVSQTLASEQIEDVGMSVVGWYHSHPTFSPDPSVRDIETQQKFQYWFSKGGNHFVGVIISPYNSHSPSVYSDIRCLTISETHSKEYLCNIPYKFDYQVIYRDNLREILGPASELAEKYSNYVNRVMLSCQYKSSLGITCLSKMLQSVKRLLIPPDDDVVTATTTTTPAASTTTSASSHFTNQAVSSSSPASVTITGLTVTNLSLEEALFASSASTSATSSTQITTSTTSPVTATSTSSTSSIIPSTTLSALSKNKIDEVLHWLEQIFLEKFSQTTPRSPPMGSLSSPPH